MFQTEPIRYLQSFETEWLTEVLSLVSLLGDAPFYISVLILVTFGLSFRKGFLLFQALIWCAIVTDLLKNTIGLPRPAEVDSAVKWLSESPPFSTPFTGMGGAGFWDLPDPEAIRFVRERQAGSFGIPSGHVSLATTFWGGLSLLFRHRAVRAAALVMIALMPLSRMYLGRHFLADVLAGLLLGSVFLAAVHTLFLGPGTGGRLLELSRLRLSLTARALIPPALLLLAPLLLLLVRPWVHPEGAGHLFGLNAAFLLLASGGLPDDRASWIRRAGRVGLTLGLYAGAVWAVGRGVELGSLDPESPAIRFASAALPGFVSIWGGATASLATGLYVGAESSD